MKKTSLVAVAALVGVLPLFSSCVDPAGGAGQGPGNENQNTGNGNQGSDDTKREPDYGNDEIDRKLIEFNGITYKLDYNREFNGTDVPPEFTTHPMDLTINDGRNFSVEHNVIGTVNDPENLYISDGVAHLIEHHYVDAEGVYHQDSAELRGLNLWCDHEMHRIKNPKYCGEGYYEIKFKMPKVKGVSFALFLYSSEEEQDLSIGHKNPEGYAYTEVDFCEIKILENGVFIEPLGGMHIQNSAGTVVSNGYQYNAETFMKRIPTTEDWFNQWHTLQAVWNKNHLDIYYDGVLFRNVSVPDYMGGGVGKYGLFLRPEYCDYPWEDNPARNKVDWSDDARHDYQIDYVRYYTPVTE